MPTESNKEKPTHVLRCRHSNNSRSGRTYYMKCILLKVTKKGNAKIILFGERDWAQETLKRSIRYVPQHRLSKI